MTTKTGETTIATTSIRPAASDRPRSKVRAMLRVLGPAWIVMLADVDAPSVLTAAKAGTRLRLRHPSLERHHHPVR